MASDDRSEKLEIYKLMVEMADRVSQRRQASNSFYLTLNTLIFGGTAYVRVITDSHMLVIAICMAGIMASVLWASSISSYKTLNTAKFAVIHEMELGFSYRPFTEEWRRLDPDQDGIRHKPFHVTEVAVPRIFLGLYCFQVIVALPWRWIAACLAVDSSGSGF